jgi:hypothetical protein
VNSSFLRIPEAATHSPRISLLGNTVNKESKPRSDEHSSNISEHSYESSKRPPRLLTVARGHDQRPLLPTTVISGDVLAL